MSSTNCNLILLQERFISELKITERAGIDKILQLLEESDFFTAPASSKFHLATKGGLLIHSLNVLDRALEIWKSYCNRRESFSSYVPRQSVVIAALLHDICKINTYVKKEPFDDNYTVSYKDLPLGHGEKSVIILLNGGLALTRSEMLAIRWHMGAWKLQPTDREEMSQFNTAKEESLLLTIIQTADALASAIDESSQFEYIP